MKIDIDELITEAVKHMEDEGDLRWSIGTALQSLYWDKGWKDVQERLVEKYLDQVKANTYS
jgi:hypothetical protein